MPLPTAILPGFFASAREYRALRKELEARGYPTRVVPLTVRSWVPTVGGRPVTPILEALDDAISEILSEFGTEQVNLIGHSAGGWIARIYLGSEPYCDRTWNGLAKVASLITLGTPHISQERWTRWNLDFVNNNYPGAFHSQLKYCCLAGRSTFGRKGKLWRPQEWNGTEWLAHSSYELTGGKGDVWGDGITPIEAAHLEGADNQVLEDVYHSPRGDRRWYGSPDVLDHWQNYLQ